MARSIPTNHPLRRLFDSLVQQEFRGEPDVAAYVANLMSDFAHVDSLYRIRNSRGKRLEEVGEMMIESNPLLGESPPQR